MDYSKVEDKLPNKLSSLIRVAIADLKKVERSSKYRVDMNTWHAKEFWSIGQCSVCLAGSVMAMTLKAEIHDVVTPSKYQRSITNKLSALDEARCGNIGAALQSMGEEIEIGTPTAFYVPIYWENKAGFKKAMLKVADIIEIQGY